MTQWTVPELLTATAYGTLFLCTEAEQNVLHCRRLRKSNGFLQLTDERKSFKRQQWYQVERGHIIFVEKNGFAHVLRPENGELKTAIAAALKRLGGKR